jgi:hypothetical protein
MFFFNNCRGRQYRSIYGIADAFYDLRETGFQANKATTFTRGEECIVATSTVDEQIRFTRYRLDRIEKMPDEREDGERVFCGQDLHSDTLSKGEAVRDPLYSVFFDKNGNFKRQSVLQR